VHQGLVSYHHGVCCIDRIRLWQSKGVADFEAISNLQRDGRTLRNFAGAIMENRFHVYGESDKGRSTGGRRSS